MCAPDVVRRGEELLTDDYWITIATRCGADGIGLDFPAEYYPKKGFTSCVRRRKWIRHRRYVAVNSWSLIPSVSGDEEEPFIDVSVGGQDLPGRVKYIVFSEQFVAK